MDERETYEAPELTKNENLKEMTKFDSVVSPINGGGGGWSWPSWPFWPT